VYCILRVGCYLCLVGFLSLWLRGEFLLVVKIGCLDLFNWVNFFVIGVKKLLCSYCFCF
jgi:hypothetical protein